MKYFFHSALLFAFLGIIPTALTGEEFQLESKVPLGLAYDGKILWIADAESRELTGYDVAEKKRFSSRVLSFDVRDLAYWAPNLVTVIPNYIIVLNPLNGDLVDKIYLKSIDDPVAIALDMHQAYIYNRSDKKIHRFHLIDRIQMGAFSPEIATDLRSLTFYKGSLWGVAKDSKAYKISTVDGSVTSFLPLPQSSFGISFVDGGLYVAKPNQVRSIDFIETENYVAAAKRNFTLKARLHVALPWNAEERAREMRLQLNYAFLPLTAHQRLAGLRADPFIRFGRREDGAHTAEILLERKSTEMKRDYTLQFQVTLFNLTHIFSPQLMRLYFKNPELADSVRKYLEPVKLGERETAQEKSFRKQWLSAKEGKHPIFMVQDLKRDTSLSDPVRCAVLRGLGVPCRRMYFMDLDTKRTSDFLQVFIQPTGWVTITSQYSPESPREFPVANNELELFSPDDITIQPKLKPMPAPAPPRVSASSLLNVTDVQVVTSSIE